jgi:pimeloyl-ACP methyl ester carboxylesterase
MISAMSLEIPVAGVVLQADVNLPESAQGVVLFAHGSGSGRYSPRNRYVASELNSAGLATVLVDLLTAQEERIDARTYELRFDIDLLSERLAALTDWLARDERTAELGVGLFGASTGAAAALVTAAMRPNLVQAVVSRGGRPDLAGKFLRLVRAPTLLIVGEQDPTVIELNRKAMSEMSATTQLVIVPRATHLFEEPGTLEQVAGLAREWFVRYLRRLQRSNTDRLDGTPERTKPHG